MAAGVTAGDIIRVDFVGSDGGSGDIINVYRFQCSGVGLHDEADVLDDILAWAEALALLLKLVVTATTTFVKIRAINLTTNGDIGEANMVTTTAGAAAGDDLPPTDCYVVTFTTDNLSIRGRKFFGMVSESLQSGSAIAAGALTDLADLAAFVMDPYAGGEFTYIPGVLSTVDSQFHQFENASVAVRTGTQRRRHRNVGS